MSSSKQKRLIPCDYCRGRHVDFSAHSYQHSARIITKKAANTRVCQVREEQWDYTRSPTHAERVQKIHLVGKKPLFARVA